MNVGINSPKFGEIEIKNFFNRNKNHDMRMAAIESNKYNMHEQETGKKPNRQTTMDAT